MEERATTTHPAPPPPPTAKPKPKPTATPSPSPAATATEAATTLGIRIRARQQRSGSDGALVVHAAATTRRRTRARSRRSQPRPTVTAATAPATTTRPVESDIKSTVSTHVMRAPLMAESAITAHQNATAALALLERTRRRDSGLTALASNATLDQEVDALLNRTQSWTVVVGGDHDSDSDSESETSVYVSDDEAPVMDDDDDDLDLFALEDRDEACKYQRKIGGRNARSCTDEPIDVTQQHSGSNLEAKIKAIAHYLKNVGTNLRKHAREGRRERLALSQFTTHKSAPDVLGRPRLSIPIRMSNSGGPSSSRDHTTSKVNLSWEEICGDASLVDDCDSALVSPVQQASPPSRKRGRPSNAIFRDDELRTLCRRCDVPVKHVTEVADMIMAGFGTHLLDVIVLEELVGCNNIVLVVGMLVFTALDCGEEYMDMQRLPAFLRHVQVRYCAENPFHNACHAADVLHTLFMLFWNTTLGAKISGYNQVGALLAAVMHDIDHVGFTNDFLLKTNHDIAIQFPSKAPMEAMHAAMAVQLLGDSKYGLLSKMTPRQQTQVKKTVREVIIATALCYQRDMLNDMKQPTAADWASVCAPEEVDVNDDVDVLPQTLQVLVLRCATHVSDISQTMKPFTVHQKWVARLNEEHFQQGDVDGRHGHGISPFFCFRHQLSHLAFLKCQVGFLMNVALPAVETLASVPWMDISILLEGIRNNIATWTSQLQDEESNVGDCISGSP